MPVRPRIAAVTITAVLLVGAASLVAGCSGRSPISHESSTTELSADVPTSIDTSFYPEGNVNLSDCIGSLERPGCGSKARGGWRMGLTFAVMALALMLIGWRLVHSWRSRDRQMLAVTTSNGNWARTDVAPTSADEPSMGAEQSSERPADDA